MRVELMLHIGPFALDVLNERLWRGTELVPLRPKPFLLLRYLVAQAGRVVPKTELLKAVWPDTTVSAGGLKAYIHDLRAVLGDDSQVPQFIETVGRRGYRFIAPVREITAEGPPQARPVAQESARQDQGAAPFLPASSAIVVGREEELGHLHRWWAQARAGIRQVVFVTGEAGIGKTTVVDTFVAQAVRAQACWLGQGQCIEHFGAGEAYLPVLSALGQLCRGPDHEHLHALLGQHAPTWLAQMPALLNAAEQEGLQRRTLGATRERMLRELTETLEVLTAEQPLVLVLEDLHWSDYATLDFLAFVARRSGPARLLVIGTYRPAEVILREHPLKSVKQELQLHSLCQELALEFLPETAVAAYLAARFPAHQIPASVVRILYQRTDGNPLFLVTLVEELLAQGLLALEGETLVLPHGEEATQEVPKNLRQMVEQQLERLSPEEQRVLEVASVAGMEFSAAAAAAALVTDTAIVERQCEQLAARQQFLKRRGVEEWPDGTLAARYSFLHALYHQLWQERVSPTQLRHHHLQVGQRKERAYGERAQEIAAELAMHFEHGRDYGKAVQYLQQAGENAMRRSGYQEAIRLLTKGLELLKTLPNTPARTQQELRLQYALGTALIATKGWAASEVERTYARALELCRTLDKSPQLFLVLRGLCAVYQERAELQTAYKLAEQLLHLAESLQEPAFFLWAHHALGSTLYSLGEFVSAHTHLVQGFALYDPHQHHSDGFVQDPGVSCLYQMATLLWLLGYPDQALERGHQALNLARQLAHPYSLAMALSATAGVHRFRCEEQAAQELEKERTALASEQGFPVWLIMGTFWHGWTLIGQGRGEAGIAQMQQSLAAQRARGAELQRPSWLVLFAEGCGKVGEPEKGLSALDEASSIIAQGGRRVYEAELYRLKGELTLTQSRVPRLESSIQTNHQATGNGQRAKVPNTQRPTPLTQEAEACFHKAIDIAHRQQAKMWELRATMSLARLWRQQGKQAEARRMLANIYHWFTEGFDTKDLQETKALLDELA